MPTTIDRKQLAEVLKIAAPVAARSRHLDRDDLLDALERVSPLVQAMQPVMFTDGVTITAKTLDVGEATEQLVGTYDLDTPLGLNPSFLADMAEAAPSGPFRLQLNGIIKPAVYGSLESGAVSLLMPIRT